MKIKNIIQESISVKQKVLENETIINTIQEVRIEKINSDIEAYGSILEKHVLLNK